VKIQPDQILLRGQWVRREGKVVADEICERIQQLISSHLVEMGRDPSGWDALYRDPDDGRLWELTYPQSELHGGGPPQLRYLSLDEAKYKYGNIVPSV
jgi:Immunity protein 27